MAGDARRLDDTCSFSGMRHARPRHGLVPRGTRRQITFTRDITICPQAKQILDGDVPSATLTDIVEPWFLGGGADGPGGAEFAAFKAEHEGKVRFHASIADMPKPDGKMMAMARTRRPRVYAPRRRRRASPPGMMEVGGFFFDSEPFPERHGRAGLHAHR